MRSSILELGSGILEELEATVRQSRYWQDVMAVMTSFRAPAGMLESSSYSGIRGAEKIFMDFYGSELDNLIPGASGRNKEKYERLLKCGVKALREASSNWGKM